MKWCLFILLWSVRLEPEEAFCVSHLTWSHLLPSKTDWLSQFPSLSFSLWTSPPPPSIFKMNVWPNLMLPDRTKTCHQHVSNDTPRHLKNNQKNNLPFIGFNHIEMCDQSQSINLHQRSSLHSCWTKLKVYPSPLWESKTPLIGLKGKERECHVTPLGSSDSHKEAQITKGKESDPAKARQAPADFFAGCSSYNEVTLATLYGVASQFVLNPLLLQQKAEGGRRYNVMFTSSCWDKPISSTERQTEALSLHCKAPC